MGYPIGYVETPSSYVLYNHVNIIIEYHEVGEDAYRIVGFYVEPLSIKHSYNGKQHGASSQSLLVTITYSECHSCLMLLLESGDWDGKGSAPELTSCSKYKHLTYEEIKGSRQKVAPGKLLFTYGVEWRRSEVHWASRWDIYLSMNGAVPDKVCRCHT